MTGNNARCQIALVLGMQCGLIVFSALSIAGGLPTATLAFHVTCIVANAIFGIVNVINITR